jgi:hypothetical protein
MLISQYMGLIVTARAVHADISNFVWPRDVNGYRLWSSRTRVVASGAQTETCKPLERNNNLFGQFASIPQTPEGLLEFIAKFGALTEEGLNSEGENVGAALESARTMAAHLRAAETGTFSPPHPPRIIQLTLEPGGQGDDHALKVMPKALLDAIWLQLVEALAGDSQIRRCLQCDCWFAAGGRSGRRRDARFCSDEHRILFNSRKRQNDPNVKPGAAR